MKNIVIADAYHEGDLKPSALLKEYTQLVQKDIVDLWKKESVKEFFCPSCQSVEKRKAFDKFQQTYYECAQCQTLYVSFRPDDKDLYQYYTHSPARLFWQEKIFGETQNSRKAKIIKPRFQWIIESTQEYFPEAKHWVDVNTAQYGYVEEMIKTEFFQKKTLLNPFLDMSGLNMDQSKVTVVDHLMWGDLLKGNVDIISLFEVVDHTADVQCLLANILRSLRAGGLCFMTAILSTGFDVQTLWGKADNIYPPDRLNIFSIEGLKKLFARYNLECLEFSTPGVLDVEIVVKAVENNQGVEVPRFVQTMLGRGEDCQRDFQDFLQANLLSSYGRILLRKKEK